MVIRRVSFIEAGSPGLHILRHLSRFDLHYAAIGIYGKTAVHKSLKASSAYLADLGLNSG